MGNKTFKSSDGMFIPRRMNRSSAFRKLTPNSIFVLLEFMSCRKMSCDGKRVDGALLIMARLYFHMQRLMKNLKFVAQHSVDQ